MPSGFEPRESNPPFELATADTAHIAEVAEATEQLAWMWIDRARKLVRAREADRVEG